MRQSLEVARNDGSFRSTTDIVVHDNFRELPKKLQAEVVGKRKGEAMR